MSSWSFRGTSLDSLGIVTLVSDSLKMTKRRGGNMLIPFRDGRVHTKKFFDERNLILGLELVEASIEALETKIDTVKTLMGRDGLGELEQTLENEDVRVAMAEYNEDLDVKRTSPVSAKLLLEFTLPEPFFRSDTLTTVEEVIDESPHEYTFTNPGTVRERKPRIILTGPLENTEIVNEENDVSLKYNAEIEDGDIVTIDIDADTGEFTAVHSVSGNVIGNITHEGDTALMVFEPDENDLTVTDDVATNGTVTIEFYPPYL